MPDQDKPIDTRFVHSAGGGDDKYQADYLYEVIEIQPGATAESRSRLFAGAKERSLLDAYEDTLNIKNFHLVIFCPRFILYSVCYQLLRLFQRNDDLPYLNLPPLEALRIKQVKGGD